MVFYLIVMFTPFIVLISTHQKHFKNPDIFNQASVLQFKVSLASDMQA